MASDINHRLEGTGWMVHKNTPDLFGMYSEDDEYVWVKVKKVGTNVGVESGGYPALPPAVAIVLADKLREFAGGAQ